MFRKPWNYSRLEEEKSDRPDIDFSLVHPSHLSNVTSPLPLICRKCNGRWTATPRCIFYLKKKCIHCRFSSSLVSEREYMETTRNSLNISSPALPPREPGSTCEKCFVPLTTPASLSTGKCTRCQNFRSLWTYERFVEERDIVPEVDWSLVTREHVKTSKSVLPCICKFCGTQWEGILIYILQRRKKCPGCSFGRTYKLEAFALKKNRFPHLSNIDMVVTKTMSKGSITKAYLTCTCKICNTQWNGSIQECVFNKTPCRTCHLKETRDKIRDILEDKVEDIAEMPYVREGIHYDFSFRYGGKRYFLTFDDKHHFTLIQKHYRVPGSSFDYREQDRIRLCRALDRNYIPIRLDYTQVHKMEFHINFALQAPGNSYFSTPSMYEHLFDEDNLPVSLVPPMPCMMPRRTTNSLDCAETIDFL